MCCIIHLFVCVLLCLALILYYFLFVNHVGSLDYVGRIDCEDTGRECLDADSNSQECRQDLGDARSLPGTDLLTHEILAFFSENFGFNAQETVALMGVSYDVSYF